MEKGFQKLSHIRHIEYDVKRSWNSNFDYPKFNTYSVIREHTKRYHNSLARTMQLGKCARMLLEFVAEFMDSENLISNDSLMKNTFNRFVKKVGFPEYTGVSINKAFKEIVEQDLFIKQSKRGLYQVNPLYFCNGTEDQRIALIRKNLEIPWKEKVDKARSVGYKRQSKTE
jgi:hypothetical protein